MWEVMPANTNNLSTARQPTSMAEDPVTLLTHSKIEALSGKASATSLDWRPYPAEVAKKPYLSDYKIPKFQKYDRQKSITKEHVVGFLEFMGPYAHDANLCLKGLSKSLMNRANT